MNNKKTIKPEPPPAVLDVFIGGASDSRHQIVQQYFDTHWKPIPNRESEYFAWTQRRAVIARIEEFLNTYAHGKVNVIGHSYGGDTACWVIADLVRFKSRRVDRLLTLDPVSILRPDLARVRQGVGYWVNIVADPTRPGPHDLIAICGGKWWDYPEDNPDYHFRLDVNHEDFSGMMETPVLPGKKNLRTLVLTDPV